MSVKCPQHNLYRLMVACLLFVGFGASCLAQTKAVKEAARLAGNRQYAEAVRLLELAMVEGDTSEALLLDLAGYYKKTGNLRMATALCKPLVDKDRPRPWHLLEVSTMLIDQGRFTDAEPYLRRFEELKPEDRRAAKLRRRIEERLAIRNLYPAARLDTFLHNTGADDGFPFLAEDRIYWSSDREGSRKQSGWTGRAMVGLYYADVAPEHGYGPPQRVDAKFNRGTQNVASPWIGADGRLYYTANATEPNRQGDLNMQLYVAEATAGGWSDGERIAAQPSQAMCLHPTVSADGRYLYYASDAGDSRGGLDLYRMTLQADGTYGEPDNLGSNVNTERHDAFPVAAQDGALYFVSQGHIGLGGFDLYVTREEADGQWSDPQNLGEPVNGPGDETTWLPTGARRALLVSDREGGDDDVYWVRW